MIQNYMAGWLGPFTVPAMRGAVEVLLARLQPRP
jgi:hypothetical protein